MPKFRVTGPDGKSYEVTAPEGASEQDIISFVQQSVQAPAQATGRPADLTDFTAFGLGDEIAGAAAATKAVLGRAAADISEGNLPSLAGMGEAGGEAYNRRVGEMRASMNNLRAERPVATTAAELLGGMAAGGTMAKGGATLLNAAKPTARSMIARGAGEGAAYGGAYGFTTGEGTEDRLNRAVSGAGLGAVTGGAAGAVGARLARRQADKAVPTTDALRKQANAAYDMAEQAGVVVSQPSFNGLVDDITTAAKSAGIDRTIHPKATAALNRLDEARGTEPTLKEMDILRRVLKGAASSIEADERRVARIMIDKLDDYIGSLTAKDVVSGNPEMAAKALSEARSLWGRMRKGEILQEAVEKAQRRAASTGSGGNEENAIRQNIRAILDNPKKARAFTPEEKKLMERVVGGAPLQNFARLVGKLSPQGNGLMAALGLGATVVNPLMVAAPAVGMVAKKLATGATGRNVDLLSRAVRSGGNLTPQQLTGPQRALAQALLIGGAQQAPEPIRGRLADLLSMSR